MSCQCGGPTAASCQLVFVCWFIFMSQLLQLFTDICVEDPCLMGDVCVAFGNQQSAAGGEEGKNPKEQKQQRLQAWCDVLQVKCCSATH